MNEISIIINGVRYDAVEAVKKHTCKGCELVEHCNEVMGLCTNDMIFKKSDKKFER